MRIRLILPNKTLLDQKVSKISAPGAGGSFQILPKHIDVTWSLVPGILTITSEEETIYYAIQRGVLVKKGDMVYVSCFQAIRGDSLESLNENVIGRFRDLDEDEKKAKEVLIRLETDAVRRFLEFD